DGVIEYGASLPIAGAGVLHGIALGRLDLDDARAHVGEKQRRHRTGQILRQIQNRYAIEKAGEVSHGQTIARGVSGLPVPPVTVRGAAMKRKTGVSAVAKGSSTSPSMS